MSQLSIGDYQALVNQLAQLCHVVKQMPVEDMIETIEEAERLESMHKPSDAQKKNLADIKKAAVAAKAFKDVAIDIAAENTEQVQPRIITPGSREWN